MQHRAQHHIEIRTAEPLPKGMAGTWGRTVQKHGPNGIMAETNFLVGRELVNSKLYSVKGKNGYHYVVPLARDLEESEADAIAQAWNEAYPHGDFVINWSQDHSAEQRRQAAQHKMLEAIADSAAKAYHGQWHRKMMNEGWRFGHKMSSREKQHPMLQSWESLPERYRVTERERFRTLLKVLEGLDLSITQR